MATVQSIERAVAMLVEIAERPGGLSDLARRVDLPTSTAGRLLSTLEGAATVAREEDGTYRIGPAIRAMAGAEVPTRPPELESLRHVGALAEATGEAAGLCVAVADAVHCVAQVVAPKPVRAEDWQGRSWPLHQGGSGLVILATRSDRELDAYLDRHPELDGTAVRRRVEQIASEGRCWSHGDYREGLSSVAAPITDERGRAVAALYVYGPTYRFPSPGSADPAQLVTDHARQLSSEVGSGA